MDKNYDSDKVDVPDTAIGSLAEIPQTYGLPHFDEGSESELMFARKRDGRLLRPTPKNTTKDIEK